MEMCIFWSRAIQAWPRFRDCVFLNSISLVTCSARESMRNFAGFCKMFRGIIRYKNFTNSSIKDCLGVVIYHETTHSSLNN